MASSLFKYWPGEKFPCRSPDLEHNKKRIPEKKPNLFIFYLGHRIFNIKFK